MSLTLRCVVCAVVLTIAGEVYAQPRRPERPYRGLFRGGTGQSEQTLTADVSLGGGYDDNVLADTGVGSGSTDGVGGTFYQLNGRLDYNYQRRTRTFAASVATSTRYLPNQPVDYLGSHGASVGFSNEVGRNGRFSVNQFVGFQPFITLGLFPPAFDPVIGQADPAEQTQATSLDDYLRYVTSVDAAHQVSQRSEVSANYSYQLNDFEAGGTDLGIHSVGGRYTYRLSKSIGLDLGYGYVTGAYKGPDEDRPFTQHLLDIGIDANRALSLTRRTTLSLDAGVASVLQQDTTRYTAVGSAHLHHEIGRSWIASAGYDRDVSFVEGFSDPFVADAVTIGANGMLNRRIEFTSSVSAAFGTVGMGSDPDRGYSSYTGRADLTIGLTRLLAFGINYTYYHYSFEEAVVLPEGFTSELDRQSVFASFRLWLPIFSSARSTDVTR